MIVGRTRFKFDLERLRADVQRVVALCPFFDETNRVSLRHRPGLEGRDPVELFQDGASQLAKKSYNDEPVPREGDFTVLHPAVAGTYLGEIFRFFESHTPYPLARYRILRLRPKTCLPLHSDHELRFHIPVVTNPACLFITKWGTYRMREAGRAYAVRTDVRHTAINASNEDRIHLVVCTTVRSRLAPLKYWMTSLLS